MEKLKSKVTILVNSCDLYSDIWPLFFSALDEYWPERIVSLVLNTEEKSQEFNGDIRVNNFFGVDGNNSWGLRLRKALESIDTEYVLAIYDDFVLEDFIDKSELETIISKLDTDANIAAVYLTKLGLNIKKETFLFENREHCENKYILLDDKIDYRLNSAPALWRKKDLLNYTGEFDNPWAWETFGTYRTFGDGKKIYCPAAGEKDIYSYNYKKGGAIYRGKWVRDVVVEKNKKYKLNIDFSQRGFSIDNGHEKRSLKWKIDFIFIGYKMIGFKVFIFIFRALKGRFL